MKICVQFYSHLREKAGASHLDLDLPENATVADLLEKVYAKIPALRASDCSILLAAGVEFIDRNYKLKPGEEISVMPPVQGG